MVGWCCIMRIFTRRIVLYRVPICVISRFGRWLLLFCSTLHWFLAFHSTNLQAIRKENKRASKLFKLTERYYSPHVRSRKSGFRNSGNICWWWNPEFGIQHKESVIHSVESRIQDCLHGGSPLKWIRTSFRGTQRLFSVKYLFRGEADTV